MGFSLRNHDAKVGKIDRKETKDKTKENQG